MESAYAQFGGSTNIYARYELNNWFSLQGEVGYTFKPASAEYVDIFYADTFPDGTPVSEEYRGEVVNDTRLTFDYLELPVVSRFELIRRSGYRTFFCFGPWIGIILRTKLEGDYEVRLSELAFFGDYEVVVEEGKVAPDKLTFAQLDYGLIFGGGSSFSVGRGSLITSLHFILGLPDLESSEIEMRSGGFSWMIGYEF